MQTCRSSLLLVLLVLSLPSHAQQYALLVGVSAYPALDSSLHLQGPQNDVLLGKEVLKGVGFAEADIRILANGVKQANGEPTRQKILGELAALSKKVQRGDYVYLQFGGHGSQQPSGRPGKEVDGLDEIFLPVDVGKWDGSIGSIKNAIRDDEMGAAINEIRARGAFVWAVFDACHSGNLTRGADGETRQRRAAPEALGIPAAAMERALKDRVTTRGGGAAPQESALGHAAEAEGGYVYFYAAQTTETTPETGFPEGEPDRKPYGVFTYTLAQVLQENPDISYRQAGERVMQLYAARNLRVTPLFEGSAIDAPVFGQKIGDAVRQWRVTQGAGGLTIKAGSLHRFASGAIFAVHPNAAASRDAEPLTYLKADKVEVMSAQLVPVAYNGKPAQSTLPAEAVVRLVDPNLNLNLRVSLPPATPRGEGYALANRVIDKLRKGGSDGIKVEWVAADKPADIRLMLADSRKSPKDAATGKEQLWLLPSDGDWVKTGDAKTLSIELDKSEAELLAVLAGELQLIAKATNLYRLAAMTGGGAAGGGIETRFYVTHAKDGKREEISTATVPVVEKGDRIELTVQNRKMKPVDITVLGIDARYGVALLYPAMSNDANRIHPRNSLTIPGEGEGEIVFDGTTAGRESILVIAVEAEPHSTNVNLGFLQQESLPKTRGIARRDAGGEAEDMFRSAGFTGGTTRGMTNQGAAAAKTTIKVYQYRGVKAEE